MTEVRSLTGIRGIAALYVAMYHSLLVKNYIGNSIAQIFLNHGYLSVDLFFILSGFVMTLSSRKQFEGSFTVSTYYHFMRKRFARIYPMYFVTLCLGFLILSHLSGRLNFIIGLSLLSILFADGYVIYHLWSLSAEWVAYLFFPAFIKISYNEKSIGWSVMLIIISMLCITWAIHLDPLVTLKSGPSLLKCFSEYILGVVAYKLTRQLPSLVATTKRFSLLMAALILSLLCTHKNDALIIFLLFVLVIAISTDTDLVGRAMAHKYTYFLGIVSYSVYLIHPFFVYLLHASYSYLNEEYWIITGNLLYVTVIVILAHISYRFIEKPAQNWLNERIKFTTTMS